MALPVARTKDYAPPDASPRPFARAAVNRTPQAMPDPAPTEPLGLRARAAEVSARALESGALLPLGTTTFTVPDGGLPFRVHLLDRMTHKVRRTDDLRATGSNPFLPPEAELVVGELGPDHLAVLNKFPVVAEHILIITRHFEHQQSPLTVADFAATALCLAEIDGLVFYNGGADAGASQAHKHLQIIPLPLANWPPTPAEIAEAHLDPALTGGRFPLEPAWRAARGEGPTRSPHLPFNHALMRVPEGATGAALHRAFVACCAAVGLEGPSPVYNLLLTRSHLLLVPRVRERTGGVALNALAFAGSLLVPHPALLEAIRLAGPLRILRGVVEPDADLPAPQPPETKHESTNEAPP